MKATTALAFLSLTLFCIPAAYADTFGIGANTFDIEFVTIDNPGNPADDNTANPDFAGSVPYTYRVGKFEISEQMIDKANVLGGLGITTDVRGPDKPATRVSWNEAARFVNWLNASEGYQVAYKFPAEPGEPGYNIFQDISPWVPSDAGYNPNNLFRNSLARYFLPSTHEWYKAAYYDPSIGVYRDYPTGSNSTPDGIDFVGDPNFDAVFRQNAINTFPNDITNVGLLSPYGTAGQGGNVREWEETGADHVNGQPVPSSSARGYRGGSWNLDFNFLHSGFWQTTLPAAEDNNIGFRVASTPEPSTFLLGAMAGIGLLWPTRRRR